MNIIDIQDQLKNFSEQQLVSEMQSPTGSAPQFLVLSEIKRRKRVRDDFAKREAAQQPTVAQEAVASAGVPQSGISGMAEAMAPKSTMVQKAMRSGGLMQFGAEIQRSLAEKTKNEQIDPFLDEVEQMAQTEFGVDSGSFGSGQSIMPVPNFPNQGFPAPSVTMGVSNPFGRTRTGGKGGAMLGMNRMANMAAQSKPVAELQVMPSPVQKYDEGGVVRAANGLPLGLRQNNPGNIRPGAGFIGETGQGGGYAQFGSEEEGLRALARLLGTYSDEYGINTLRGLTSRYAPRSDNEASFDNYVSYLGEQLGMDPDEEFDLKSRRDELIPAIVGFEQGRDFGDRYSQGQISRAIEAAGTDDPEEVARILGGSDEPGLLEMAGDALSSAADTVGNAIIGTAQAQGAGPVMTEVENKTPQEIFDEMQANKGGVPFPSSLGEFFALGRDANVPTSERVGSRQDLLGQARGEQQEYLEEIYGDQITGESQDYKDHVRRARMAGRRPMSPSEYRNFFGRNVDVDGISDASPASRFAPFSDVETREAAADASGEAAEEAAVQAMTGDEEGAAQTVLEAQQQTNRILNEGQRGAEQPGERAEYLASLDDGRDGDDLGSARTAPKITPKTDPKGSGSPDGSTPQTGLAKEIADLQAKLEKDRETDKYLALAQAGLALMSSKDPTLLGAVGEAGISGLTAFREAQERYQEGLVDLINAKAKLQKKSGQEFTKNQMLQRAEAFRKLANDPLATEQDKIRNVLFADLLEQQAFGMGGGGLGMFDVASPE